MYSGNDCSPRPRGLRTQVYLSQVNDEFWGWELQYWGESSLQEFGGEVAAERDQESSLIVK